MTQTSKEYAEALFELAAENGETAETSAALAFVGELMKAEPAWRDLLSSPAIPREERIAALNATLEGKVPVTVLAVLRMLCGRGHMYALDKMIVAYEDLYRQHQGFALATVTSPVPLTDAEKDKLKAVLEQRFAKKLELRCLTDPALLGGVRVEVDGRVLDGSIRNKLQQIREVIEP